MDINTAIARVLANYILWVIGGSIAIEFITGVLSAWKHKTLQLRLIGKIIPTAVWGTMISLLIPILLQWANHVAAFTIDWVLYSVFLIVIARSICSNLKELGFPYADELLNLIEKILNRSPQAPSLVPAHSPGMPSGDIVIVAAPPEVGVPAPSTPAPTQPPTGSPV